MKHWEETGNFPVAVAGCSHYRDAIQAIAQNGFERAYTTCEAALIPEPDNPYDANAVRVEIQGNKVGYVARDYVAGYLSLFNALDVPIAPMTCAAAILGGATLTDNGQTRKYEYQIELDIPSPANARQRKSNSNHPGPNKHSIEPMLFWRNDDHCLLIARIDLQTRNNHRKDGWLWGKDAWDHVNLYLDNSQGIGYGSYITSISKSILSGKFGGRLPDVTLLMMEKTTGFFELTSP